MLIRTITIEEIAWELYKEMYSRALAPSEFIFIYFQSIGFRKSQISIALSLLLKSTMFEFDLKNKVYVGGDNLTAFLDFESFLASVNQKKFKQLKIAEDLIQSTNISYRTTKDGTHFEYL